MDKNKLYLYHQNRPGNEKIGLRFHFSLCYVIFSDTATNAEKPQKSRFVSLLLCQFKEKPSLTVKMIEQCNNVHNFLKITFLTTGATQVPFDLHCYSLDWHPADHVSFVDTVHLRKFHPDSKVSFHGG